MAVGGICRRTALRSAPTSARRRASPARTRAAVWPGAPSATRGRRRRRRRRSGRRGGAAAGRVGARGRPRGERRARHQRRSRRRACRSSARRRPPVGKPTASGSGSSARRRCCRPGSSARRGVRSCARCSARRRDRRSRWRSMPTRSGAALAEQARRSLRAAGFHRGGAGHAARRRLRPARSRAGRDHPHRRLARGGAAPHVAGDDRRARAADSRCWGSPAPWRPATPSTSRPRRGWPNGLTVLVPYAPFEQSTPANRRMAADVEAFARGHEAHARHRGGVLVGRRVPRRARQGGQAPHPRPVRRRRATIELLVSPARSVGRPGRRCTPRACPAARWCRATARAYLVAEPYRCGEPVVRKAPTTIDEAAGAASVSRRRRGGTRPSSSPGTTRSSRRSSRRGCR